jgi:hypothetical protein
MKNLVLIFTVCFVLTACSSNRAQEDLTPENLLLCSDAKTTLLTATDKIQTVSNSRNLDYNLDLNKAGTRLVVSPKRSQASRDKELNLVEVVLNSGKVILLLEKTCYGKNLEQHS